MSVATGEPLTVKSSLTASSKTTNMTWAGLTLTGGLAPEHFECPELVGCRLAVLDVASLSWSLVALGAMHDPARW